MSLIREAKKLQKAARKRIERELSKARAQVSKLESALESLTAIEAPPARQTASAISRRAAKLEAAAATQVPRRKRKRRSSVAVAASKLELLKKQKKKDQAFARLPKQFTLTDLKKRGIAPIVLAQWARAKTVKKLGEGRYQKAA
jgi:hypothetical protein